MRRVAIVLTAGLLGLGCLVGGEPDPGGGVDAGQVDAQNGEGGPFSRLACAELLALWPMAVGSVTDDCASDRDCAVVGTSAVLCACAPTLSCDGAWVNDAAYAGSTAQAIEREFFLRPCGAPATCDCAPRATSVCKMGHCTDPTPGMSCLLPDGGPRDGPFDEKD